MTVVFRSGHKDVDEETSHLETIKLKCYMFNYSYIIDDTLEPSWSPDGCRRTENVNLDQYLSNPESTGWTRHGDYLMCPGCEARWNKKFAEMDIKTLMEGK